MSVPLFTVFALMTAAAALAVLVPLARRRSLRSERDADLAVYRDQLAEIERDRLSGRLPAEEAEAARIEVARRMLAADSLREPAADAPAGSGKAAPSKAVVWSRRLAAVAGLVLVPLAAVVIYAEVGSPDIPGAPLAERMSGPPDRGDVAILVRRVEEHLAAHPNDGQGYEILAPIYLRLGRPADAARAYADAIRTLGPTAERQSARGEALVVAAEGMVTADAADAFKAALALDPQEPRASYFMGLAAEQDGRQKDAAEIWRGMIAQAPPDAPYLPLVREALAKAMSGGAPGASGGGPMAGAASGGAGAPGPTAEDVANAATLSTQDRSAMIRSMVQRLEDRLKADPADLDGWLRLARAFKVLGEADRAKGALASARAAFAGNQEALGRIDAAEKDLALGG